MNVDEIVKALRTDRWGWECSKCEDASCNGCETKLRHDAADLIESLQAQLTESKCREKAAVEDMNCIAIKISQCTDFLSGGEDRVRDLKLGRCDVCKGICRENETCKFEWRGPQEGLR